MVPSSTRKAQYVLTSATQAVAVPFFFIANNHVRIVRTRDSVDTALAGGFTLTGAGAEVGGLCTFNGTQTAVGDRITIRRVIPLTQLFDYAPNDRFPASSHERALDQMTMLIQEQRELTDRCLIFGETEVNPSVEIPLSTRKNRLLGFDNNGAIAFLDQLGVGVITGNVIEVSSYAAARGVSSAGLVTGRQVRIAGYAAADDGAGGLFTVTTVNPGADNNGTILKLTGVNVWLKRSYSGWVNVKWFGAKGDGVTNDWNACDAAVKYCRPLGATLFFPEGTYNIGASNFPLRLADPATWLTATNYVAGDIIAHAITGVYYTCLVDHTSGVFATDLAAAKWVLHTSLEDYNGMRVTGVGRKSIIKTTINGNGADVFQLNAVKNVTVDFIAVASEITGVSTTGSNGFSFTNGCENVVVGPKVHGYALPYYDNGVDTIDGGSFLSIQAAGAANRTWKNIQWLDNTADGGTHGLMIQGSGAGMTGKPMTGILVRGNRVSNFYRGILCEITGQGAGTPAIPGMDVVITSNRVFDCQQSFNLNGCTGVVCANNVSRSDWAGATGMVSWSALKYAVSMLSAHRCVFKGNICYQASANNYFYLGGGFEALANSPTTDSAITDNVFHGATVGYGLWTSDTAAYKYAERCIITGNTVIGAALGGTHPKLFLGSNDNVISEYSVQQFPAVIGLKSEPGISILVDPGFDVATAGAPWTQGPNWSVAGGKGVATAVVSQSIFQYATLIAGRAYELSVTVSNYVAGTAGLHIYNEDTAELQGVNTQITGNGTYKIVVIPASSGQYRVGVFCAVGPVTLKIDNIALGEVPIRGIGWGMFGKLRLDDIQEFADNAAAGAGGVGTGGLYRTGDALKIVH